MPSIEKVFTTKAPKPLPQFSQAVKHNGMVYCSGSIGFDPATSALVDGGVQEQTVRPPLPQQPDVRCPTSSNYVYWQRRALQNLAAVLAEAGSSFDNVVKVNIFITTMDNFAKMNEAWDEFFTAEVKPVSHVVLCRAFSRIGMGTGRW